MRKVLLLLNLLATLQVAAVAGGVLSLAGLVSVSHAQLRQLPENGKRAVTGDRLGMPFIAVGRERLRLAPGGLIFDIENRTILHHDLPQGADVLYQTNLEGDIQRLYILTPYERKLLDARKK
jgi:hypothetical protein